MRMLCACSAVLGLVATSAFAQYPMPSAPPAGLTRQAVIQDLALWQRAGLGYMPSFSAEPWITDTRDYREAYAIYLQLRQQTQDMMTTGTPMGAGAPAGAP